MTCCYLFLLDGVADVFYQFVYFNLIIQEIFVIIVHLLQEIDAAQIALHVMDDIWDLLLELNFYLLIVFNNGDQKSVRKVKELTSKVTFRDLSTVENIFEDF